jgi:hypothetical protein
VSKVIFHPIHTGRKLYVRLRGRSPPHSAIQNERGSELTEVAETLGDRLLRVLSFRHLSNKSKGHSTTFSVSFSFWKKDINRSKSVFQFHRKPACDHSPGSRRLHTSLPIRSFPRTKFHRRPQRHNYPICFFPSIQNLQVTCPRTTAN